MPINLIQIQFQKPQPKSDTGKKPDPCRFLFGGLRSDVSDFKDICLRQINSATFGTFKQYSPREESLAVSESSGEQRTGNKMDEEVISNFNSEDSDCQERISPFSCRQKVVSETMATPSQSTNSHFFIEQKQLLPLTSNNQGDNGMIASIHRRVLYHILDSEGRDGGGRSRTEQRLGAMDFEIGESDFFQQLENLSPEVKGTTPIKEEKKTRTLTDVGLSIDRGYSFSPETFSSGSSAHKKMSLDLDVEDDLNNDSQKWIIKHPFPLSYFKQQNHELLIFDCRFNYEYQEGHIRGAINFNKPSLIEFVFIKFPNHMFNRQFLKELKKLSGLRISLEILSELISRFPDPERNCSPLVVFHCEFSYCRAPEIWKFLRSQDRKHFDLTYPDVTYPQIYLLKEGYSKFFEERSDLCVPNSKYAQMNEARFESQKLLESKSLAEDWATIGGSKSRSSKHRRNRL